jgi:hypothetical protein
VPVNRIGNPHLALGKRRSEPGIFFWPDGVNSEFKREEQHNENGDIDRDDVEYAFDASEAISVLHGLSITESRLSSVSAGHTEFAPENTRIRPFARDG